MQKIIGANKNSAQFVYEVCSKGVKSLLPHISVLPPITSHFADDKNCTNEKYQCSSTPTPLRTHYVLSQFATVNGAGQFETDVLFLVIAQQQFADEACWKDLMKQ